ncbi:MAG: PQQ-dependent sugar dehydrogenase [bacterium]|nr:PQQ-dependent sugar dehydrogenase [bacterium]
MPLFKRKRSASQHTSIRKSKLRRQLICETLEVRRLLTCDSGCLPGEVVEAESAVLSGSFAIGNDTSASGGQFISTPSGVNSSQPGNDFAEFTFQVSAAGSYTLRAVVDGPVGESDSFFVTINDQPTDGFLWDVPAGWTKDTLSDRGGADPVVLTLEPGLHTVRFHLRDGGTRLDNVTLVDLNQNASLAQPGELVEAESGLLFGQFTVGSDATASAGQFITTPLGIGVSAPGSDFAEYRFDVPQAGQFVLEARVDGPADNANSFFVTVNDQPVKGILWDVPSGWTVDQVADRNGIDPSVFSLAAGVNTVRFYLREGGTRLDSLTLVDLTARDPAKPGELVEAESAVLSGSFTKSNDASASGGQFISTPSGINSSQPGNDFAEFTFQVTAAGSYTIRAVVDGPLGESDSFFVTINDQPTDGYLWDVPSGWTKDTLSDRGGADPVILTLEPGLHTVRFHLRDGGTRLDNVTLVDLNQNASLAQPGELVEAESGLLFGRFAVGSDATASAAQFIATPLGIGASAPGSDFAEYRFDVPAAGQFLLEARVDGPADNANSFFVTVNDQPVKGILWDVPSGWTVDQVADRNGQDPSVFSLAAGVNTVRFYLREGGTRLDSLTLVETNLQPPISANGTGLIAEYFDNIDLTNSILVRKDSTIDFDWGGGSPDPSIESDTFSVRWSGEVEALYTEVYTFEARSDDGIRVFVGGDLIIDAWYDQPPTTHTGTVALNAGQLTPIRVEYYENTGGALTQLSWSSASQVKEIIPTSQLYEPAGVISLSTSLVDAEENAGSVDVMIRRQLGSRGTLTVDYQTFSGSASAGTDYQSRVGTVIFPEGVTEVPVRVPIINDDLAEPAESFTFTIDNVAGGGSLLAPRTATVTIIDDDTSLPDFDDFGDTSNLILNGNASVVANELRLTANEASLAGSSFFSQPLTVGVNTSFQTEFQFRIGGGVNGADGMVFMLQNSTAGASALGGSGGNLGYAGIGQSLAVEFDTYQNPWDANNNHISVLANGNLAAPLQTRSAPFDLNSGDVAYAWVDYNASSDLLAVYISDTDAKPAQPLLTASADLAALTQGQAFVGFSAGTGGLTNSHEILSWKFRETGPPVIPPPGLAAEPIAQTVASGLVQPIAIDWSDSNQNMLIAEQRGIVRVVRNGTLLDTPFIDISAQVNGVRDRGLLDIAVHPDFINNPYVYLLFTYDPPEVYNYTGLAGPDGTGNRAARLIRVKADSATNYTTAIPGTEEILLGKNSIWENLNAFANSTNDFNEPPAGILSDGTNLEDFITSDSESHSVGAIEFGPDGALFVTTGDGTSYNRVDPRTVRVQDIDNLSGKVLRIDPATGEGLSDNPFFNGDPNANRSKVYQYGLRNPFRMAVDQSTGQLFVGDVGWTNWEEINAAEAGANFGWPYYEGGSGTNSQTTGYQDLPEAQEFYNAGGLATPSIFALNHAASGINAIVMGDIYTGNSYPDDYQGDLFFNDLGQGIVRNISFDEQGNISSIDTFATGANIVVQIKQGPDGNLYFVDLDDGRVGFWYFVQPSTTSTFAIAPGGGEDYASNSVAQAKPAPSVPQLDTNGDKNVTAIDALLIINHLNSKQNGSSKLLENKRLDTNGDQAITALDALLVINELNRAGHSQFPPPDNNSDDKLVDDWWGDSLDDLANDVYHARQRTRLPFAS